MCRREFLQFLFFILVHLKMLENISVEHLRFHEIVKSSWAPSKTVWVIVFFMCMHAIVAKTLLFLQCTPWTHGVTLWRHVQKLRDYLNLRGYRLFHHAVKIRLIVCCYIQYIFLLNIEVIYDSSLFFWEINWQNNR